MERAQRAAERRRLDEEKKLMQHKKTQVYVQVYTCTSSCCAQNLMPLVCQRILHAGSCQ